MAETANVCVNNTHDGVACPNIAFVLLWFPLSSETFIFREICALRSMGMSIGVYTLYGKSLKGCSEKMREYSGPVCRLGVKSIFKIGAAFFRALKKEPRKVVRLMRKGLFRRMRNLESLGENIWSFMAGFYLAEKFRADHIQHIHSGWANGPATAAWVASRMSGIPFSFTGRAGDIYPEDGILREKAADALFIRTNNAANTHWLSSFCPPDQQSKVKLVYNSFSFSNKAPRGKSSFKAPYRILAVGRFVRTKGFPELLTAMARLRRENFPVELTLVGDGAWRGRIERLRSRLRLETCVHMTGFVPNDALAKHMAEHDVLVVPSVVHGNGDRDGIPNVIMEALSLELPVVATDVCGINEVIRNGKTGLLVPQRDPRKLAEAIRKMLGDDAAATRMARAGCRLVARMFDSRANSEKLRSLYCQAIGGADGQN